MEKKKQEYARREREEAKKTKKGGEDMSECKTPPLRDQTAREFYNATYTLGERIGWLQELADSGLYFGISYWIDLQGNPSGGKKQTFGNASSLGFSFALDFEKMMGIPGFSIFNSWVYRSATNLTQQIGNKFNVAQLYGGNFFQLNELYAKLDLFGEGFRAKAGRLNAGNDFLVSSLNCKFVNNGFCGNPTSIFSNIFFSAYPTATWGAYMHIKPTDYFLMKYAIYNENPHVLKSTTNGFDFSFNNTQGMLLITQWDFMYQLGRDWKGYPGNFKAAFYYLTKGIPRFIGKETNHNLGFYFELDQMIYQKGGPDSKMGLTPFAWLLFAPKEYNMLPFFMTSGLVYTGILPTREKDSLCLGIAYGTFSSEMRTVQRNAQKLGIGSPYGREPQNFETVLELNYWIQVTNWWQITPDIQYVINPDGLGTIKNAWVFGAQIGILF